MVLTIGDRGGDVRLLQEKLRKLGFPCGNVDGSYGDMTANGVAAFQRQHGLKGQPGAWYKSYDAVLGGAPASIPEERKDATPATLEARGDVLSRALRLVRNVVAWFGLLLTGLATPFEEYVGTPLWLAGAWLRAHTWLLLGIGAFAVVVILELIRIHRAREYAASSLQVAPPKTEA